jgi:hypothetical protein
MTFQEMVTKALELRVTVVGHRVMAVSIDSRSSECGAHDWRRDGLRLVEDWRPYELPHEVEEKLLRLMDYEECLLSHPVYSGSSCSPRSQPC